MRKRLARQLVTRYRALLQGGADPLDAERRAFAEFLARDEVNVEDWSSLYEDFLKASAPDLRRRHGVYYTPPAVVSAQVRLVDDVLKRSLGCEAGFADERVLVVDPAAGSGAYPLAIAEHAKNVRKRMVLFEPMPGAAAVLRAHGLEVNECDALASGLERDAPIVVCLGNPPYRRRASHPNTRSSLDGFLEQAAGVHLKNLYNDYVYFWRWALRVAFESRSGPAIVCFVTAASYLRGPAFAGFRTKLRQVLDELWLIDLEGDQLAARASDNVFPIRTPVAIALGVRYAATAHDRSAVVHYTRLRGSRREKLDTLGFVRGLDDVGWRTAASGWGAALTVTHSSEYATWPRLTELFPWQLSGAQLKRTWPIGTTPDVLRARWKRLLELPLEERGKAFGSTRDRDLNSAPPDLRDASQRLQPLRRLPVDATCRDPVRYAYRSFDRHWVLPDARLGDFMRSALWRVAGPHQIFLTSLLTNVLGRGPAAVATAHVPDLDHFRGSFGARAVIPLWRDAAATQPNVAASWLTYLSRQYGFEVDAEALMAYCYAMLATRGYVERFDEELRTPGPRMPLTPDGRLFRRCASLGSELLGLHTYRRVCVGAARCVEQLTEQWPRHYTYDGASETLSLGDLSFRPIPREVWEFSVSGYRVVPAWVRHRLSKRGKSSLDAITPERWTRGLTDELLELLWVIEATLALEPALDALLDEVVSGCRVRGRPDSCATQQVSHGLGTQRPREDEALSLIAPELLESVPL